MTDRITAATPSIPAPSSPSTAETAPADVDFRALLRDAAESIARGEATLDGSITRLSRGGSLSPEQLIALQATVYRHAAEVEMAAKLVDKLTSAVRTTLTSQQ